MYRYKSKFEKRIAKQLKDAKVRFEYEKHSYKYQSKVRSAAKCGACGSTSIVVLRSYTPDFFLDSGIIIETKGKWTAADRYKMLDVREAHPLLDIRMLFMCDNKISRVSKTRYSTWCEKNGLKFAVGKVPQEWLK